MKGFLFLFRDAACSFSYVGVSRTDDPSEAVTGIIRYNVSGGSAPERINVGGVKYYPDRAQTLCGYDVTGGAIMGGASKDGAGGNS